MATSFDLATTVVAEVEALGRRTHTDPLSASTEINHPARGARNSKLSRGFGFLGLGRSCGDVVFVGESVGDHPAAGLVVGQVGHWRWFGICLSWCELSECPV